MKHAIEDGTLHYDTKYFCRQPVILMSFAFSFGREGTEDSRGEKASGNYPLADYNRKWWFRQNPTWLACYGGSTARLRAACMVDRCSNAGRSFSAITGNSEIHWHTDIWGAPLD